VLSLLVPKSKTAVITGWLQYAYTRILFSASVLRTVGLGHGIP